MVSKWMQNLVFFIGCMVSFLLILMLVGIQVTGDPVVEFNENEPKNTDPGVTITMVINYENTGDETTTIYLDDPILPEKWDSEWPNGNSDELFPEENSYMEINITIPGALDAHAGFYQINITGDFEAGNGTEDIPGHATLNITVQTVYDVDVSADETEGEGEPGERLQYLVEVQNTGNDDDTFHMFILRGHTDSDPRGWITFEGDLTQTNVSLSSGEKRSLTVFADIPNFTPENDEAECGEHSFLIRAKSENESDADDEVEFFIEVEDFFKASIWCDIPDKQETLKMNDDTIMTFTISIRNLGNAEDDFRIYVPEDELSGEKSNWEVKFGTQPHKTVTLQPLHQQSVTLTVIVDNGTNPGIYSFRVFAESQSDTAMYEHCTITLNLSKARYGLDLIPHSCGQRKVNPADYSEIEFKFTLRNTGNQDDTYTVKVETSLTSGTYKDWIMEFDNDDGERVDQLSVPSDLPGSTDDVLGKNDRVDITLYVIVATDTEVGEYGNITISATSDTDHQQVEVLNFSLKVIRPNIRLSAGQIDFFIEPSSEIDVGDDVDINLRVYNDGNAETDEFTVYFYNGISNSPPELAGDYIGYEAINNVPAGTYYDVTITWMDIPLGANEIYAYADKPIRTGFGKTTDWRGTYHNEGAVSESREDDNTATISELYLREIDFRPDLTILTMSFQQDIQEPKISVRVTIENIGTTIARAGSAFVELKIDNEPVKKANTNTINPPIPVDIGVGKSIDMMFIWDVPSPSADSGSGNSSQSVERHYATATVSHSDDKNQENNNLTMMFETTTNGVVAIALGPDISVSRDDIVFSPVNPQVGERVLIIVTIRNSGNTSGEASYTFFELTSKSTMMDTGSIEVDALGENTFEMFWEVETIGIHGFAVVIGVVDPQDGSITYEQTEFTITVGGESPSDEDSNLIPHLPVIMVIFVILVSSLLHLGLCSRSPRPPTPPSQK